jgi:hypothetical protein
MKFIIAAATAALLTSGAAMAQSNSPVQKPDGTGTTGASVTTPARPTGRDAGIVQVQATTTTTPGTASEPKPEGQPTTKGTDLGK